MVSIPSDRGIRSDIIIRWRIGIRIIMSQSPLIGAFVLTAVITGFGLIRGSLNPL
jgi:multisubunit Na+/H+ antiporter MnhC subunit